MASGEDAIFANLRIMITIITNSYANVNKKITLIIIRMVNRKIKK